MATYALLHQPAGSPRQILMLTDDMLAAEEIAQELRRRQLEVIVCGDDEARQRIAAGQPSSRLIGEDRTLTASA